MRWFMAVVILLLVGGMPTAGAMDEPSGDQPQGTAIHRLVEYIIVHTLRPWLGHLDLGDSRVQWTVQTSDGAHMTLGQYYRDGYEGISLIQVIAVEDTLEQTVKQIACSSTGLLSCAAQLVHETRVLEADEDSAAMAQHVPNSPGPLLRSPYETTLGPVPKTRGVALSASHDATSTPVSASVDGNGAFDHARGSGVLWLLAPLAAVATFYAVLRPLAKLCAMLGGFTRLSEKQVAKQDKRRKILDVLATNPGITTPQMANLVDAHIGTIRYHLRALQAHGLAFSHRRGKTLHHFSGEEKKLGAQHSQALCLLAKDRYHALAMAVKRQPGITQTQLCQATGLYPSRVHDRITALTAANLICQRRAGRCVEYYPTHLLRDTTPDPASMNGAAPNSWPHRASVASPS